MSADPSEKVSSVNNGHENQHWSKIKSARLSKANPSQQTASQPGADSARFTNAKSVSEKSSNGSLLATLDEQLKLEINKKVDFKIFLKIKTYISI